MSTSRPMLALALVAACGNRSSSKPPPETASAAPAADAAVAKRWPGPCVVTERRDGKPEEPVTHRYDDAGRWIGWSYDDTDFGHDEARMTYDTAGRLVEEQRVDKLSIDTWRTKYDPNGHPVSVTNELITPEEPFKSEFGPEVDQVIEKWRAHSEPEKQVWSAEWDAAGHLAVEHLNQGEVARYTYDAAGRVLTRDYDDTHGGGSKITYTYRASGPCQPLPRVVVTMQGGEWQVKPLDDAGCPASVHVTSRDGATPIADRTYEYDTAGNLTREEGTQYDLDNLHTGAIYTYDGAGNVTAKFWLRDGGAVEPFATYDYGCWTK